MGSATLLSAKMGLSGLVALVGQMNLNSEDHAFVMFVDNCGTMQKANIMHVSDSSRASFFAAISLENQHTQVLGRMLIDDAWVSVLSEYGATGIHIQTSGFIFELATYFYDATALSSGNGKVLVGLTDSRKFGANVLVTLQDVLGNVQWAYAYDGVIPRWEEATAVCECPFGIVVVGTDYTDAFVLVLDLLGNVTSQRFIKEADLTTVKCTKNGGFAAVGATRTAKRVGLFLTGNNQGDIVNVLNFTWPAANTVVGKDFVEEASADHFAISFNVVDRGYTMHLLARINLNKAGYLISARYLDKRDDNTHTYSSSIFPSPQGGYSVAGHTQVYGSPSAFYFAEMTNSFDFPGNERYISIPIGDFVVSDVTDYAITRPDFVRQDIKGFEKISLSQHVSSTSISENTDNFADLCVLQATTVAHSAAPSTDLPSISPTELPTVAPSVLPTAQPQTDHPTNHPVTSKPTQKGDTNEPTADPSSPPSNLPTASPTPPPTVTPSLDPSAGPTVKPSTDAPSAPPSASPSAVPSVPPSKNPSAEPTSTPSASPSPKPTAPLKQPSQRKPAALVFNWSAGELAVVGVLAFLIVAVGAKISSWFCPERNIERNRVLPVRVGDEEGIIVHAPRKKKKKKNTVQPHYFEDDGHPI
jgi:hypothetical protein